MPVLAYMTKYFYSIRVSTVTRILIFQIKYDFFLNSTATIEKKTSMKKVSKLILTKPIVENNF